MAVAPLLVWSWTSHGGSDWAASERVRALALGHALAVRAGFRVVFYGDAAALAELPANWPWETRALPPVDAPKWFWSASKLVALADASARENEGTPALHIDHDALVCGPLAELEGAGLYADHLEEMSALVPFYPLKTLTKALGDDQPVWWDAWRLQNRASSCSLIGGSSRRAVAWLGTEPLRLARLLDERGAKNRLFTWPLEQGLLHASALLHDLEVRHALTPSGIGTGFATWPGEAKSQMIQAVRRLWPCVPPALRAELDATLAPLPPPPAAFAGMFAR